MEDNTNKPKSVWNDTARIWGRIAAVLTAVGLIATAIVKIFSAPPELTYSIFAALGVVLLVISFYVDKQSEYTQQEIIKCGERTKKELCAIIKEQENIVEQYREESDKRMDYFSENVDTLVEITKETRRDTVRIQLLMMIENQPKNTDTILRLAETYFVELEGDWYMTSEFYKWAKANDIIVPANINNAIKINDNK